MVVKPTADDVGTLVGGGVILTSAALVALRRTAVPASKPIGAEPAREEARSIPSVVRS